MRIAFIGGCLSRRASGVKVVVERLSAALEESGQDIRVFGLEDEAWAHGDADAWTGAPAQVFTTRGMDGFGYAPALYHAIEEFCPDLVHVHGLWMYGSAVSARFAQRGVANVISPHGMLDSWALRQSRLKKFIAGHMFEYRHLREAAALHALNYEEATSIRSCGLSPPVAVLPNGVDTPDPGALSRVPSWRSELPFDARVLLYLGRLHPKKNLTALIEAFSVVRRYPWHLVIAGPDQNGEEQILRAEVIRRNMQDHVHFIGPQFGVDKSASFAVADGFVLPSLSEGLPMAVLEAWRAGLPVLMSEQCNLPEGFSVGAAICSGTQVKSISCSLQKFFALSSQTRASIGARGLELVSQHFSWSVIASSFIELYEWCSRKRLGDSPGFIQLNDANIGYDQ